MLKFWIAHKWLKPERQDRPRQNNPVAINNTQIRHCMWKLFKFENSQFHAKVQFGLGWLWIKNIKKKKNILGIFLEIFCGIFLGIFHKIFPRIFYKIFPIDQSRVDTWPTQRLPRGPKTTVYYGAKFLWLHRIRSQVSTLLAHRPNQLAYTVFLNNQGSHCIFKFD